MISIVIRQIQVYSLLLEPSSGKGKRAYQANFSIQIWIVVRYKFMLLLDWTVDTTVDRSSGIPANLFLHISFKKKFNSLIGVTLLKKSTGNNRLLSFPIYSPGF